MIAVKRYGQLPVISKPDHLWATDPKVAAIRRSLILHWIRSSIILWALVFLVVLIYLGSGVNPNWYTQSLDVIITDFDQGLAGGFLLDAFRQSPPGNLTLNWIFQQPADLSSSIVEQIERGKAWAGVYINAGTSEHLNRVLQSILTGNLSNNSYHPSSAVTIVFEEGRNFNTINSFVLPAIRAAIAASSTRYAAYFRAQVATSSSNLTLASVMAAISLANITHSPISYTSMNLHAAFPYASLVATSLGYLFLWFVMLNLVNVNIRLTEPLIGQVKVLDIAILRIVNTIVTGLLISLVYSLCVLWFANFTRLILFIRFWLFNWLVAITFTAISGVVVTNLGVLAPMFLPLFLITSLAASTINIAIELQHRFYRIGYGLPLYHCFSGGRHLLFGSYTKFNVDIAVLLAYYVGAVILMLATSIFRMRKQEKEIHKKTKEAQLKRKSTPAV